MDELLRNLKITINDNVYLKDPESSSLGRRIVEHGILLINDLGFDNFTFKISSLFMKGVLSKVTKIVTF